MSGRKHLTLQGISAAVRQTVCPAFTGCLTTALKGIIVAPTFPVNPVRNTDAGPVQECGKVCTTKWQRWQRSPIRPDELSQRLTGSLRHSPLFSFTHEQVIQSSNGKNSSNGDKDFRAHRSPQG
jgi:hypothetical protein